MISIITPVHRTSSPYLKEAYESLVNQTGNINWEWVICPNGGGKVIKKIAKDPRVRVIPVPDDTHKYNSIGRIKNFACSWAKGNILVELDADDLLVPMALTTITDAFKDNRVVMVYSNSAEFKHGTWESKGYSEYWGWRSRPFVWKGHKLKEMIAWEPSAHMMRRIEWAPNHVRAWRTKSYRKIGGHDINIKCGDDHDLNCRFYLAYGARGIHHIDECLYLYRIHGENSCVVYNADVQAQTHQNYMKYSRDLAVRWANDEGLKKIDLGGRFNTWDGFETVDLLNADIITDLNKKWPFKDNSVGVIKASHIVEHLHDSIHTMNEAYRVLAPGGWMFIDVPSVDGRGAFQDPTHVSFWNQNSFWYYTNRQYANFIRPKYRGKFQVSRLITFYPTEHEKENQIPVVQADLIALKSPYSDRPVGEVLI